MKSIFKLVYIFIIFSSSLYADIRGTSSIFVFYNGIALEKNEVLIDSKEKRFTDSDGSVNVSLSVGEHLIEVFAKDDEGNNLGYAKKTILIKESRDTQVIITFKTDSPTPYIDVDTPVGVKNQSKVDYDKTKNRGTLNGLVLTSDKNMPIQNARVFVKGTSIDAKTDKDGKFSISIPSDVNMSISIVHSEYSAQTISNIFVKKDHSLNREVKLTPASMELEEFIVLAPKVQGSIASIMAEEKNTNSISNIIGSEEFSKKGDSDAASALKRVTGVTLIGGKSIYVRGLGDRYSNVEMNSMPLPSPNPTKRVVPLDIFPSGVIGSMKVQKSATPDIPSSFGGGYVNIRTKSDVPEDYVKVSVGLKGNSNTGDTAINYQGSSSDYLGFDDGYRDIDPAILENSQIVIGERQETFTTRFFTKDELSAFSKSYTADRNFNVSERKLPLGGSLSLEGAVNFELDDGHKLTLFGNYKYAQNHTSRQESWSSYEMDTVNDKLYETPISTGTTDKSYSNYSQANMFNIAYSYKDLLKLTYTKLYTHEGVKGTRVTDGEFGSNNEKYIKYFLDWQERTLTADQINGSIDYELFNQETNFRFGYEKATAELKQPNNYSYSYLDDLTGLNGEPFLTSQISNHISTKIASKDKLDAMYLKNKFHFDLVSDEDYIDIGYSESNKEREYRQDKYYLAYSKSSLTTPDYEMINDVERTYDELIRAELDYDLRTLRVQTLSAPKDYFDATVEEKNLFVSTFLKYKDSIELLFGGRQVDITQTMYLYKLDSDNPDFTQRKLVTREQDDLSVNKFYPSMSLKYKLDEDNHIDFAYSTTYIMPDLVEASDTIYSHPYEVADVMGNPDLVNTEIASYDLKFSHYFSSSENIKVGIYYKDLDKPIENVMVPSSSLPIYSFDNSDSAIIYGIEFDGRKNLGFISNDMKNYFISGNFTYSDSEVTLTEEQEITYTTNARQLQGLSQVVINLAASYEISDRSVTLSYNKMGERIRKVGMIEDPGFESESRFPDFMEDPAAVLDLVWIEKYDNGLSFKIKLGNLLDEETIWYQGEKSNITNKYKKGVNYSFTLSYKY